jgi:hypothetical protein
MEIPGTRAVDTAQRSFKLAFWRVQMLQNQEHAIRILECFRSAIIDAEFYKFPPCPMLSLAGLQRKRPRLRRGAGIPLRPRLLHRDRAAHGTDDARNFHQHAVAGGLDALQARQF